MIMLFIAWYTAHTYSVILIPLLVCTFLYYHGIANIISNFPTKERILSHLNKKRETNVDEKTVKEVLCSLRAKNLFNSNEIAESEENGMPNLPTADIVHIKPVELGKIVKPCNLNSQQASQGTISNPLTPARIRSSPPFSVYTPTPARIINTKKYLFCSTN